MFFLDCQFASISYESLMYNYSLKMLAKPIAVTLVGDGMVGKTCLLSTFLEGRYSNEYNPTVIEKHSCSLVVDGVEHNVTFKDTAGQEDYDKIRRLSYPYVIIFL